jgi:hypothetical protein
MGIRFKSNTWRSPLRLIDNFLPARTLPDALPMRAPSRVLQVFARAGWLNRPVSAATEATMAEPHRPLGVKPCNVRVVRTSAGSNAAGRHDMRMVISGRIGDVCAELDRLAAQEQSSLMRRA